MRTRTAYYEQSVNDLAALIHAAAFASNVKMQHKVLVAERQGKPVAFVVMATAGDMASARTPFIIEWAGEPEATAAILAHAIRALALPSLDIHVNWFETGLNDVLESIPAQTERNSGTVHIVNVERLCTQLGPYWRARATAGSDLAALLQDMDDADRVALLFDPTAGEESRHAALPIPFPYTVGLNYV
jgi:hypothetical protein